MPIKNGNNGIGEVRYGNNVIGEIYFGNNLVYSSNKVIDLGTNTTFNVSSVYPGYANLTADNFFLSVTGTVSMNESADKAFAADGFDKSYNASTGVLTMRTWVKSQNNVKTYGSVHAYLVTKPSKLISLGTKQSFDVTLKGNYRNFTANNFLIKSMSYYVDDYFGVVNSPGNYTISAKLYKKYNSTSGILTAYFYGQLTTQNGDREGKNNVTVYLIPGGL